MTDFPDADVAHRELTFSRLLAAPTDEVFDAWIEPAKFAFWFGGALEVPLERVSMDVRPGGKWRIAMLLPEGEELPFAGEYRVIERPDRLVLTIDEAPGADDPDGQQILTVTFTAIRDETSLVLEQAGRLPAAAAAGLEAGYGQFFDRLEELLARE